MAMYEPLKIEPEILEFWQKSRIFDKLRGKLANSKKRFSFLDGPITANNPMGVHHAWGRTYKDVFQRFWAMRGFNQRWQNGFDCQGLWIEREVEKERGFKGKRDIENFGLLNFAKECKARVEKFSKLQIADSVRLGQWMDWDNNYYTMTDTNNEHNWMLLKEYHKKGWLYKGKDAVPWCPRCGTASSKHDIVTEGYKEVTHTALFMKFPIVGKNKEYILIFTTTPWTVPANVAAAVNETLDYVKVRQNGELYWLAEVRAKHVLVGDYEVLKKVSGKDLIGMVYEMPYPDMPEQEKAPHKVVGWELATGEEGTGIVHIAPGCGPEDFQLGKRLQMPSPSPLDETGNYRQGWKWLVGEYATLANKKIIEDMKNRSFVYKTEPYRHRYPHCWRCGTELVFRLEDEWYVKCGELKAALKEANEKIKWYPEYGKVRQDDWFDAMHDWLISRKRFWGLPLPFWECSKCGSLEVIGSVAELRAKAIRGIEQLQELHRPWIDNVILKCPKCGGETRRVPDVGDAWLDAGIVPFSTIGPYMQNRNEWEKWYPADFICENMPGQYRGWFNAILWSSVTMTGVAAFKSILGYETVKDETGREMHKSLGNAIWAGDALKVMGADPLRWRYCLQDPTVELWLGYRSANETKKTLNVLLNMGDYVKALLPEGFEVKRPVPKTETDRWIFSRLESTKRAVTFHLENLRPDLAAEALQSFFLEDLSRSYVHFVRESVTSEDEGKTQVTQVLYAVLLDTLRLAAPFVPFIAEKVYKTVFELFEKKESVHLLDWSIIDESMIDTRLEAEMANVQGVVSGILAAREKIPRSLKWPVKSVTILSKSKGLAAAIKKHEELVKRIANVLEIKFEEKIPGMRYGIKVNLNKAGPRFGKDTYEIVSAVKKLSSESVVEGLQKGKKISVFVAGKEVDLNNDDLIIEEVVPEGLVGGSFDGHSVYLNTEENKTMLQAGFAREFTRSVQALRKKAGMQKHDRVELYVYASPDSKAALEGRLYEIKEKVGASKISFASAGDTESRKWHDKISIRGFESNFGFG